MKMDESYMCSMPIQGSHLAPCVSTTFLGVYLVLPLWVSRSQQIASLAQLIDVSAVDWKWWSMHDIRAEGIPKCNKFFNSRCKKLMARKFEILNSKIFDPRKRLLRHHSWSPVLQLSSDWHSPCNRPRLWSEPQIQLLKHQSCQFKQSQPIHQPNQKFQFLFNTSSASPFWVEISRSKY